jgi:anti-sigma factor RsiW
MHSDDASDSQFQECDELLGVLSEYLEGELTEELRREVILHAQTCIHCAQLLNTLRRLVAYCQTEPTCEMPTQVRRELWLAIRHELYTEGDSAGA